MGLGPFADRESSHEPRGSTTRLEGLQLLTRGGRHESKDLDIDFTLLLRRSPLLAALDYPNSFLRGFISRGNNFLGSKY